MISILAPFEELTQQISNCDRCDSMYKSCHPTLG